MKYSEFCAVLCEGASEQTVMEILLDWDLLIFSRSQLVGGDVLRIRKAENFSRQYLNRDFDGILPVYRILDSRRERFRLSPVYSRKVHVMNVITAPEIEMLVILKERKLDPYKKSGKKPSDFCKMDLGLANVKKASFLKKYFKDPHDLVQACVEYRRISKTAEEMTIADLLK